MNCQEFWSSLPQRGCQLNEEQSDHLAECAACGGGWEPYRALADHMESLAEEWRGMEAPPRVEAGLISAFRAQAGFSMGRSLRHSWWTPVFAWASAAAAMIAFASLLIHGSRPTESPTVANPRHAASSLTEMAAASPDANDVDADFDDDSSTLGEGFVQIPNVPPLQPNEPVNFVRVEAPASDLIAMGVPVGEERAAGTVMADLAYGADGRARAVRLVSDGGTY